MYTWYDPNGNIIGPDRDDMYISQLGRVLKFLPVKMEHAGTYRCDVRDAVSNQETRGEVRMQVECECKN